MLKTVRHPPYQGGIKGDQTPLSRGAGGIKPPLSRGAGGSNPLKVRLIVGRC
ncbi:hypothetical protein VL20_695 [Microcystis panniformis FACHB-1757]|uniref:Uncharacterized protein n=1 Tax=Microcystis panniformis FACHB-1757 TaxID=1638788 RepID=A0A0K1RVH4_9CHRO|nr:hypothetical protein VL20_695 [Microcystis panniformis FACHB-1757]